jgi:hypothetical protein
VFSCAQGTQCTLFPFFGALTDSDVACWDLWYNMLFVHDVTTQEDDGSYPEGSGKWDKAPGINPYVFGYIGLALAISISVLGDLGDGDEFRRRGGAAAAHPVEEPDQHHFLRGCCDLRDHHGHHHEHDAV